MSGITMSHPVFGRRWAPAFALLASVVFASPSFAAPPAEDIQAATTFLGRLTARGIVASISENNGVITVQALAPLVGANDASLADVARAAINAHGLDDAQVNFVGPSGPFASFSRASGLSR
jgi:type II secretory pathway component PulM